MNDSFNLLTMKPVVYVANVTEDDYADPDSSLYYQAVKEYAASEGSEVIAISANIEEELSKLSIEEKTEYLNALGVNATGLDRLVKITYKLLKLSTFFTVGADEVRAWNFKNGMSAPQCAGTIHTDFERGFICAEVYAYEDIEALKTEKALKENGKIRTEGKAYKVKDGLGSIEQYGGLSVVYTKEAETADMYIEKTTHTLAKQYKVRVATSDTLEQVIILGSGARRISALAFQDEVKNVEKIIQDFLRK